MIAKAAKTKKKSASRAEPRSSRSKGSAAKKQKKTKSGRTAERKTSGSAGGKKSKATPKTPAPAKKASPATKSARKRGAARPASKRAASARARTSLDLGAFREALLDKRRELIQSYQSAKGDTRNRIADGTEDYIDYAVSSYDREFLLSLTEMEQRHLMLVEEALKRIDRGGFGRCAQCDREIPAKRLEVQPWALYCVRCQELEEQGLLVRDDADTDYDDEDEGTADDGPEDLVEGEEIDVEDDSDADDEDDDTPLAEDRLLEG